MIREATAHDIPRIVELGSRSLIDGPYKDLVKDTPEQSARLALQVIEKAGRVLLWEENGRVSGMLAFILFPHYFTGEMTAGELMWYVEPEARPGGAALRLLWAAEELAHSLGAKKMQFTAPNEQVGDIYKRFGYGKIEVSYQKELKCQSQPA